MKQSQYSDARCALAVAHPGHEIRVFGWMERNQPVVSVLTDGSGRKNTPRIKSSLSLIDQSGSTRSHLFGSTSDRQLYAEVLAGNAGFFLSLADQLAREWTERGIDLVLGDAEEGCIMAHDLWREVINRAVGLTSAKTSREIGNLAFSLEQDPRDVPSEPSHLGAEHLLNDEALQRKICAAEGYRGLEHEVEQAFAAWGRDAFRHEILLNARQTEPAVPDHRPAYEQHGEELVQAGIYGEVVRYSDHVRPIVERLREGARAA